MPEKEAPETAPDSPLPDLSDAAVKKLTHSAKKRGYVTHDQINSVLPSEEVNSQEIEDVLADETEVIEPDERRQRNGKDESTEPEMQNEGGEIVELKCQRQPRARAQNCPHARMTRCACICARWARLSCSRARAR